MNTPSPTPQLVTVEVDRYSGDEHPATYEAVEDLQITEQGVLTIDHDVTADTFNRTFYAAGQWATASITGLHKAKPEPEPDKPGRRRSTDNPYGQAMPGTDPYAR